VGDIVTCLKNSWTYATDKLLLEFQLVANH